MADLTEDERVIISETPLGHSLDDVREALRNAEGDAQGEAWLEAVSELVTALLASRACRRLASRIENRYYLSSNLGHICTRLEKHELPVQVFRPLSQLVLNQASDIDIWTAVIAVIATLNKDTPSTYQPLSWSPFEYTATEAEAEVFDEICNSTHCAVGGFHPKYFEGHEWNSRAKEVWQRAKSLYSDSEKKWLHLPLQPTEDSIFSWWLGLQKDFLATEQAAYFGRPVQCEDGSDSEDYGSDSEHCGSVCRCSQKLELLVKKKKNGSAVEQHDWRDVLAIGRVRQSEQTEVKELLLQLGSAVREVFARQPTRRFVHAFTLTGTTMETWVFDRSGPYSGATFNVHEEPEKLVQVLCGYLMMSDEELGLDIFTEEKDGRLFVTVPVNRCATESIRLELNPNSISYRRTIVSRATTCFPAKPIGAPEFDRVVKYSWTPSTWTPEADLLSKANEHRVKGVAKMMGYEREITRISKLRDGLTFSTPHKDQIPYDDRVLRVLAVTPLGRPLNEFGSILELLECLRDAIKVHRSLYMESGILHGDISVNNIIMTEPAKADGYKGMLIDFDSAHDITKDPSGRRHRTGTIEFMAIGVLLGQQHTYRHDLESFLYVFIWLCFVYGPKGKGKEPTNALRDWSTFGRTLKTRAKVKFCDMGFGFKLLMKDYPAECGECVKQFITTIHDILFKARPGVGVDPHEYTPEEPDHMYEPILEAFEKTIREIRQEG
ncbi:hypothetical protein E4U57_001654 [Claviceps arundinis]|uniref:non-specific serine/threonine protein kinase n=2 Tax=Claviceps arundinis TaxID=1623583 RepID=A0ABQ7PA37_9HYPO|nr:hypothetical protein E4U57_001654 [Claviceps arundinis]